MQPLIFWGKYKKRITSPSKHLILLFKPFLADCINKPQDVSENKEEQEPLHVDVQEDHNEAKVEDDE